MFAKTKRNCNVSFAEVLEREDRRLSAQRKGERNADDRGVCVSGERRGIAGIVARCVAKCIL